MYAQPHTLEADILLDFPCCSNVEVRIIGQVMRLARQHLRMWGRWEILEFRVCENPRRAVHGSNCFQLSHHADQCTDFTFGVYFIELIFTI